MKEDSTSQAAPEHDEKTGSFAPRTAGEGYYEQENAKKKSRPRWPVILVLLLLGAGGTFGWMKYQTAKLVAASLVTPELIASIAALNLAEEEHGHAAAAEPEMDLRERAQRSISAFKTAQSQLVARAKSTLRLSASQQELHEYARANPTKPLHAIELGAFRALLAPCFVSGHDVHWISEDGSITEHVASDATLPAADEAARQVIQQASGYEITVFAVLYQKGVEYFEANGQRFEPIPR